MLRIERGADRLLLVFQSQASTNYQVQTSTDLVTWKEDGAVIIGNGNRQTQEVSRADLPVAVFRLSATEAPAMIAPDDDTFAAMVVGGNILGYLMVSATRFSWFGEDGDWVYTRLNRVTGRLVFTYDDDGNSPGVYREEALLIFETPTEGTFRYSEFDGGVEDPSSVINGLRTVHNTVLPSQATAPSAVGQLLLVDEATAQPQNQLKTNGRPHTSIALHLLHRCGRRIPVRTPEPVCQRPGTNGKCARPHCAQVTRRCKELSG